MRGGLFPAGPPGWPFTVLGFGKLVIGFLAISSICFSFAYSVRFSASPKAVNTALLIHSRCNYLLPLPPPEGRPVVLGALTKPLPISIAFSFSYCYCGSDSHIVKK